MVSSKVAQWKGELVKGVIDKIEESIQSVDTDQTISSRFVTYKVTSFFLNGRIYSTSRNLNH